MTLTEEQLRQMVAEDEFGLLDVPAKPAPMSPEDRLLASFNEIVDFVTAHGREPELNPKDIGEMKLAMRLKAMAGSEEQRLTLAEYDALGLLQEPEPPSSIEEVVADDDFGLLDSGPDIHTLKHVPRQVTAVSEEVARRETCKDFERFEPLFRERHADLRTGRSKLTRFKSRKEIVPEKFYVVGGVLVYVAEVGEFSLDSHGRPDARLRLIYENGTESNMLRKSLATRLYENGKVVTEPTDETLQRMGLEPDTKMGHVYVLRSLSEDPQLAQFDHLHKIGSTIGTADERTATAYKDTTFLHAAVEVVAEYEMPAVAVRAVEGMLHRFFAEVQVDAWFERNGVTAAEAQEWFDAPLPVIDEAIELIQAETITSFRYDRETRSIQLSVG